MGSRSGGFWSSTNGGATWNGGSTDFLPATGVDVMTASPTNSDSVLINVRNAQNGYSHGVYRSTDGGANWTVTAFNPSNLGMGGLGSSFVVSAIAYHPNIANLVFVGTNQGLYRSIDNLQTWTLLLTSSDIKEIAFHPTNNDILYIYDNYYWGSNQNVVLRSTDQGLTFSNSATIAGNTDNRSVELSTTSDCPNCLFFASDNGVWKSTDNGQNFTFLINPNQGCGGFAVNDTDQDNMVYGYLDLERTTDGAQTFNQATAWSLGNTNGAGNGHHQSYNTSTNYIHADLRRARSINGHFYVATDGFLNKSLDGGQTWLVLTEGVGTRENYSLGISQSDHFRSVSGSQDNGTSLKTKEGWVEIYGADGMEAIVHPLNPNYFIGSVQYGNRRKSTNGGLSTYGASPQGSSGAYWVAPIAYDPNDQMVVYDFRDFVYRSDDFSETHTQLGTPSFTGDIQIAEIAQNNSQIMVVCRNEFIEKSTDGGLTFTSIKNNLPNYSIQDIAFDPNDDNVMIVVYGRYQNDNSKVWLTTDGGATWSNITFNLGNMPIRSVVIDQTNFSTIYLGAEIGVFYKTMLGTSWSNYNTALPNVAVRELEINYGSNTLKAATWGRGLWEFNLLGRAAYPAILNTAITNLPTLEAPKASVDQYVTSKIHYTAGALNNVQTQWSTGTPNFQNTIPMVNISDTTWRSTTPIPNFPSGTKVFFRVVAEGANGEVSTTYKFMYTVKDFEYCQALGDDASGNLFINNVNIENLNNSTNNDTYTMYSNPLLTLYEDSSYTLNVSANTSWADNDYGAWIDFNADASFSEDEKILFSISPGNQATNTFTVPHGIDLDDTVRMRVRLSYWGSNPQPCGTAFGEVEDYLIVLKKIEGDFIHISENQTCSGNNINIDYSGNADSVLWTFDNGTNQETYGLASGTISFAFPGVYDLTLNVYNNGLLTVKDSLQAIMVSESKTNIDVIDACSSYEWIDGNTYTQSNNSATHTMFTDAGCDSVITLNLTITNVDISVVRNGLMLSANASNSSFQWIDCGTNSPISGATNQDYTVNQNGSYAVEVTTNGCTETSECFIIDDLSIDDLLSSTVIIYPNPNTGKFQIDFGQLLEETNVSIFNSEGKLVHEKLVLGQEVVQLDIEVATGVYNVQLESRGQQRVMLIEIKK